MSIMQKNFAVLFFMLSSILVFAQSSSTTQKTLITKRTATWCPNCGTWGWDMAKGVEALRNENAILIRAHYSGILESKVANDITENFDAIYQPEFFINEERQNVGSSTWSAQLPVFDEIIDENAKQEANVSFTIFSTFEDNKISTEISVDVMKALDGEYFLAAYLIEDSIEANQASLSSTAIHNSVLRASFTEDSFGEMIIDGSAELGFKAELDETMEVEGDDVGGRLFRVLAVVWKKVGTQYQVENVHESTVSEFSSVSNMPVRQSDFRIYQTGEKVVVEDIGGRNQAITNLDIFTISGSRIQSQAIINKNQSEIYIDVNKWSGQIVLVRIITEDGVSAAKKLYIK
jgi:hypothetical protein